MIGVVDAVDRTVANSKLRSRAAQSVVDYFCEN